MRRPSLRSQLNQIRLWVRQGRTDAWIAHKLDISVGQLEHFKRDHGLIPGADPPPPEPDPVAVTSAPPPLDDVLEADDDEDEREPPRRRRRGRRSEEARSEDVVRSEEAPEPDDGEAEAPRRRRRGRRGGRRRSTKRSASFEATFDHGEEGYGLWLDPAVADNPIYEEHWAGHRAVAVVLEADSITIRRADVDGDRVTEPAGTEEAAGEEDAPRSRGYLELDDDDL